MTTRSVKLFIGENGTAGAHLLYTTPANVRTIVKWFGAVNHHGTSAHIALYVKPAGTGGTDIFEGGAVATYDHLGGMTWVVLDPTDELWVYADVTDVSVSAAGAELPIV